MWAHVQYLSDKIEADVPETFFEGFKTLQLELFKQYNVFWSPKDRDTPSKVLAREHKILHVDEIKRTSSKRGTPLAGYYRAIILKLADSEEELANLLSKERIRRPVETIMETFDNKSTKRISSNTKKQEQAQKERARVANLKQLNASSSSEDEINNKTVNKDTSDHVSFTEHMEVVEKNRAMEAELIEMRSASILKDQELKILNDQLKEVTDQNKELVRLNIRYQQLMDSTPVSKSAKSCKSKSVKRKISFESSDLNENCIVPKLTDQIDVKDVDISIEEFEIIPTANCEEFEIIATANNELLEIENPSVEGEDQLGFALTDAQFKAANRVTSGIAGDSKFIKNCIDILWTREQLCLRSATGAACPNITNSEARPACSPEKKAYLQVLLNSRMDKEKYEVNDDERTKRMKKLMEYLRSKIKTVRRGLTN